MRQPRFERGTFGSGGRRSIQLSYWRELQVLGVRCRVSGQRHRSPWHLAPGTWHLPLNQSGRVDLNHRPPGPEPGALTGLRYAPSAPRRTRTPSLLIRSQALYPVELWARVGGTRLELVASTMSTWRSNQLS